MVCNIIDECRCYAYSDVRDPRTYQFCGVRKGPDVFMCPPDCCDDGCPGQKINIEPREPFRIIDRPPRSELSELQLNIFIFALLVMISIVLVLHLT
jgi:hypothetical protein